MYAPSSNPLGKWTLALLPLFLLPGCATTESVSTQTGTLNERIAALDEKFDKGLNKALSTANEAKYLAARQEARMGEQEKRLQDQAQLLGTLREDISRLGTDNAKALAQLRDDILAMQQAQGRQMADRVSQQLDKRLADTEARMAAQAQAQADSRVRDAESTLSGRMDLLEKRLGEVGRMAEEALAAQGLGPRKIFGKVVHNVTLTDDKTLFPINSPDLGNKDMTKLDAVAEYVKKLDVNYHIGIHGHTDGLGSDDYNYALAKARAEVVKNYLHEKTGIPLLRMSVISHGATDVSLYRQGSNRRIVVEVLQ